MKVKSLLVSIIKDCLSKTLRKVGKKMHSNHFNSGESVF